MAVTLSIELDFLKDPAVSRALSDLVLALGGSMDTALSFAPPVTQVAPALPAPAPVAAPVAAPQPAAAPQPVAAAPAPVAPAAPAAPAAAPAAAAPKPAPAPAAAAPKPAPGAPAPVSEEVERYRKFFEELPERSRRFLELVKKHRVLTIETAMEALDIDIPKAMGGITGSIGRWAPVREVPIPYEAITHKGRRAWRWLGEPGESQAIDLQTISDGLPDDSRRFLHLLSTKREVTVAEALSALNKSQPKAMGGVTDPIKRRCEELGVEVPYTSQTGPKGRIWTLRTS